MVGRNFGCGSSREHTAWALFDYGFKAVVSGFFADIFKNNALNNSLLPVEVSASFLQKLLTVISNNPKTIVEIDLPNQQVRVPAQKMVQEFEINPYKKICLLNSYDDVDYLLSLKKKIEKFEKNRNNDYSNIL